MDALLLTSVASKSNYGIRIFIDAHAGADHAFFKAFAEVIIKEI